MESCSSFFDSAVGSCVTYLSFGLLSRLSSSLIMRYATSGGIESSGISSHGMSCVAKCDPYTLVKSSAGSTSSTWRRLTPAFTAGAIMRLIRVQVHGEAGM